MNTRSENVKTIAAFPFVVFRIALGMAWMVATAPAMLVVVFVTLGPAELCWAVSPFVGIVHPAAGHRLASLMEPAVNLLAAAMDFLWKPLDLLAP